MQHALYRASEGRSEGYYTDYASPKFRIPSYLLLSLLPHTSWYAYHMWLVVSIVAILSFSIEYASVWPGS